MSKTVDMELKKAFAELQSKMVDTSQKVTLADHQIESQKRTISRSMLTDKEMVNLPIDTRVYDGIGRMFVLTDVPRVRDNLKKKEGDARDKIKTLEQQKEHLEKSLKEAEQSLRELVQSKRERR